MRLLERPQLTLGYDGNRREHHGSVLTPLKTQRFPGVALAERDLATLSDDFDFDVLWGRFYCFHAIMLSCGRALRQTSTNWQAVPMSVANIPTTQRITDARWLHLRGEGTSARTVTDIDT
jgi:hypothetical protein